MVCTVVLTIILYWFKLDTGLKWNHVHAALAHHTGKPGLYTHTLDGFVQIDSSTNTV